MECDVHKKSRAELLAEIEGLRMTGRASTKWRVWFAMPSGSAWYSRVTCSNADHIKSW